MNPQAKLKWIETRWINSVAISNDGKRVVAATFYHDYSIKEPGPNKQGSFETYCYDADDNLLWSDAYAGWDGVFAVAISGDGRVAAAGGCYDDTRGLLRAYNARTGETLLDGLDIAKRVSLLTLSDDGNVLGAAAERAYVFARLGGVFLPASPAFVSGFPGSVTAVAVHSSGNWLVCCDKRGNVRVATIANGVITNTYSWPTVTEPIDPANQNSPVAPVPFLCAATAKYSDVFAVAGGNGVYVSSLKDVAAGQAPARYDFRDGAAPPGSLPSAAGTTGAVAQNVRWVAVSGDGSLVTAVANRTVGTKGTGSVVALSNKGGTLTLSWQVALENNPNSTSIDAPPKDPSSGNYPASKYVTVADGYPVGVPAKFYLFNAADGTKIWDYNTNDMNWPMFISADGSAIAAGSDNGGLYLFDPQIVPPTPPTVT